MRNLVKWIYAFMVFAILIALAFSSCGKDQGTATSKVTVPIAASASLPSPIP